MSDVEGPQAPLLTQRIDALLADAEAGGALALQAARQAAALSAAGDPERYRRALAVAARLDPLDASPRLALARRLAEEGDLAAAERQASAIFADAVDRSDRAHAAFVLGEIARARGAYEEARPHFQAAATIEEAILAAEPRDTAAARWYARALGRVAELDIARGDFKSAGAGAEGALSILRALAEQLGETPMLSADVADAELRVGVFKLDSGDAPAAGEHLTEAIGRYETLVVHEPEEPHWRAVLADSWALAAEVALARGASGAARSAMDKALHLRVKLAAQDPNERWALAATWRRRAALMAVLGEPRAASESLNQARALSEQACAETPGAPDAARFLVHTLLEQADHALACDEFEAARLAAAEAQRWAELFAREKNAEAVWRADLASAWDRLGDVAQAARRNAQAQDAYARAIALRRMAHQADPSASSARGLAASLLRAGECALAARDFPTARAAFAESASLRLAACEAMPSARAPARDLATALERVGLAAAAAGDANAARGAWEEELRLAERIFPNEYDTEGLRFRAIVEANLARLGGQNAENYRKAALARFDTLARERPLSAKEEELRASLWKR